MRRPPAWTLVLVVVGIVAAGVLIDRANPSTATARPEPVLAGAAMSGAWYCAVGDTTEDAQMRVTAAVPPGDTDRPADVTIDTFGAGEALTGREISVPPGTSTSRDVATGHEEAGVASRWWDEPAAVGRSILVRPTGGPEGYIEGPCEPEPSARWIVPGVATSGGAQALLTLANPFDSDASVTITFPTPDGLIEPQLLENVVVPKRSTRTVLVNEHAPEEPDLGILVRARSGRVVAEAVQTLSAAIGGVDGVSLVKATAQPAETWTVPWFDLGEDVQSWLWVTNVEDRPAALALTLHASSGGIVPEEIDEITLEAGETRRIDLRDLLPEGTTRAGVTVRSENSVPVAASVATEYAGADVERTGFAVQLGAAAPDSLWVLSGGPPAGRDTSVHLSNPGSEPASVDVLVASAGGAAAPADLQGIDVPPGAMRSVDLTPHLPEDAADHSIFVVAREGTVVPGRRGVDRVGTLRLVAGGGVPGSLWAGGRIVPPVDHAPTLTQRLGTDLGPRTEDPLEVPSEPATATPTPLPPAPPPATGTPPASDEPSPATSPESQGSSPTPTPSPSG
ncbi:MAG: hypothetical protein KY461_10395 [Actinobacteria bacterium]|nr:hypothetical protein [Actinomycetota bacterium]